MVDVSTNIFAAFGAGSGMDVKSLVSDLVMAERVGPQSLLDARKIDVEAKISARGSFLSSITTLTDALSARILSGALSGLPKVSDPSVLAMEVSPGTVVSNQTVEVRQLAQAQTITSGVFADSAAELGAGEIRIRFGSVAGTDGAAGAFTAGGLDDLVINVTPGAESLEAIKNLINANATLQGAPVQAQIVSDANGARLILRGATGEASGFIIETSGDPGLDALAFNEGATGGMSRSQVAADALLAFNGVDVQRSSSRITDLVEGVTFNLLKAAPGAPVAVDALRSEAQVMATVDDFVGALNELQEIGKELTSRGGEGGTPAALSTDSAAKRALRSIAELVTVNVLPEGTPGPRSLSDLGVSIDRDGTFIVDNARLAKAAASHPDAVEKILSGLNSRGGFNEPEGALRAIGSKFSLAVKGSGGYPGALQMEKARIKEEQARLDTRMEQLESRYTKQFTALDRALSLIKSQQDFLKQQIDLWTRRDNY